MAGKSKPARKNTDSRRRDRDSAKLTGTQKLKVDLTFSVSGTIEQEGAATAGLGSLGGILNAILPMVAQRTK